MAGSDPDGWIRESYSRILASCVYAGLPQADADDVAQDIWVWLMMRGTPLVAMSMPWMSAVARNFILRYRRRRHRQVVRERLSADSGVEPRSPEELERHEVDELFEKTAALLPETERRLLGLIRSGYSQAESARMLKIPRGSRAYHHARVVACARRELRAGVSIPIRPGKRE